MSNYDLIETGGAPVKAWIRGVPLEDAALRQLCHVAQLPFIHSHVAVMPDVHWGRGATVGSVIPTLGAIVPAAVGVDIGCGMCAVRTDLVAGNLPDSLAGVRREINGPCPSGARPTASCRVRRSGPGMPGSRPATRRSRRSTLLLPRRPRPPSRSGRWAGATTSSRSASMRRTGCD